MLGAIRDGVTDDLAAIQVASDFAKIKGGKVILSGLGSYAINGHVSLSSDCVLESDGVFYGAGTLLQLHATDHSIVLAAGANSVTLRRLTVTSGALKTGGGAGVLCAGSVELCLFEDVFVENHYFGFYLTGTNLSWIRNCRAGTNASHGFFAENGSIAGLQWVWDGENMSSQNGGSGYCYSTLNSAAPSCPVGTMKGLQSYDNDRYAFEILGKGSCGIFGLRVEMFFFGEDDLGEVYLDTYGTFHSFRNGGIELAGSPSATAISHGFTITSNNTGTLIANSTIGGCNGNGIRNHGKNTTIFGCSIYDNGWAGLDANTGSGIYSEGSNCLIAGCAGFRSRFDAKQIYAAYVSNNAIVRGNVFTGDGVSTFNNVQGETYELDATCTVQNATKYPGWNLATGTAYTGPFNGNVATATECGQRIKAIEDVLRRAGIL